MTAAACGGDSSCDSIVGVDVRVKKHIKMKENTAKKSEILAFFFTVSPRTGYA